MSPVIVVMASLLPAGIFILVIWLRYGREPSVINPLKYLHQPPSDDPPAVAATLLEPGTNRLPQGAFASTLFDLLRRGYFRGSPVFTVNESLHGLREREVLDLAIEPSHQSREDLRHFEQVVYDAVIDAMPGSGALLVTNLHRHIRSNSYAYRLRFREFVDALILETAARGWWRSQGYRPTTIAVLVAWGLVIAGVALVWGLARFVGPSQAIALIPIPAIAAANGFILLLFLIARRGWESRSADAAVDAVAWTAFRNFLRDFHGIQEASPASIEIWERYLCYGIAFGISHGVLKAAEANAPDGLVETSAIYLVAPHIGQGINGDPLSGLSSTFADVLGGNGDGDGGAAAD